MNKRIFLIGSLWFCCLFMQAATPDMTLLKQNIYEAYLRVLNNDAGLQARVREIERKSGSPDIMIRELSEKVDDGMADKFCREMREDGSWADLDYKDLSRSGWSPSYHAERLMVLAKAYRTPSSRFYGDRKVAEVIHRGMGFWFLERRVCRNWWYNQVGVPKMLGCVFILMESELSADERANAIKYMSNAKIGMTGQNRTWLAGNVLVKALLEGNEELVEEARKAILEELIIRKGEGIQSDWSFHQHGAQQQFGNYGLAYLNSMTYWARVFSGTKYALSEEQLQVLRNYLLEGMQWTVWKGNMDISACVRQIFKYAQEGKTISVGKAVQNMMVADKTWSGVYRQFYDQHVTGKKRGNVLVGNRVFPKSDMIVHRTPTWSVSVKMSSSRVIGSEIVNDENLLGYYLGDGAMYVYRDGREYRDIFPVWDWTKVPGVTGYANPAVLGFRRGAYTGNTHHFAGGVSDGKYGVAAEQFEKDSLVARKSWFFIGDAVVCLGSGITGRRADEVTTAVNQCLKRSEVVVGKQAPDASVETVWHDGVGYVFPDGGNVLVKQEEVCGDWHRIALFYDTMQVKKTVFTLFMRHGVRPADGGYLYVVYPDVNLKELQQRVEQPAFRVLYRTKVLHAVESDKGTRLQVAFFEPGSLEWQGERVAADKPCMMMVEWKKGKKKVWVGEPGKLCKVC